MDAVRFDALIRSLSSTGSRRALLQLLTTLPLAGALVALLEDESAAKRRRQKRKDRHRQKQEKRRDKRHDEKKRREQQQRKDQQKRVKKRKEKNQPPVPGCQSASKAQTCDGKCASVTDNCGTPVDCGACVCAPPCGECFTCDPVTDACIVDFTQVGDDCGESGQVCQADGSCACSGGSCGACRTCQGNGACTSSCDGSGCCDGATCQPGTHDDACGIGGADCRNCPDLGIGQTCGGGPEGTPGVCGCTPTTCAAEGKNCGFIPNGCSGPDLDCGACPLAGQPCTTNVCGTCVLDCAGKVCGSDNACGETCTACSPTCPSGTCAAGQLCCGGDCLTGVCCEDSDCAPSGNTCVSNQCACGGDAPCPSSLDCCGDPGSCTNTETNTQHCGDCGKICPNPNTVCQEATCTEGVCGTVPVFEGQRPQGCHNSDQLCCDGVCQDIVTAQHCGACNSLCPSPGFCQISGSGIDCLCPANENKTCQVGETCCTDGCKDLDKDPGNCGTCGFICNTSTANRCTGGECMCGQDPQCTGSDVCDGLPGACGPV